MTELKKIELTEEALDQVSGGKINFGKNTFKKIAIVGAAIMLLAIGGVGAYELYKHKSANPHWDSLTKEEKDSIMQKINKQNQEEK